MHNSIVHTSKFVARKCGLIASPLLLALTLGGCGSGETAKPPADATEAKDNGSTSAANNSSTAASSSASSAASAQPDPFAAPSDDQIKKDVAGRAGGILEIKLSDEPGKKEWSSAHSQYFWERGVKVRRNANLAEAPDAILLVDGFARYSLVNGQFQYREFKVTSNEYEGIPRPSEEQALAFIKKNLQEFLGGTNNVIVHADQIAISIAPAEEQEWVWHSPKSVSFNVHVKYDQVISDTEIAPVDALFEARLYRDEPKQDWQRILGFEKSKKEGPHQKLSAEELRALKRGA